MTEQSEMPPSESLDPWRILVVDDEPDVHDVTRLVLGRMEFAGRRLAVECVHSGAVAAARLGERPDIAVILLDVVMESDDAGLRLVEHIRNRLNNRDVQIVLRTGQPGQAPEREVMLNYDINGYFLKTEVTAQKLSSVVIAALRTFAYVQALKHYPVDSESGSPPAGRLEGQVSQPFRLRSSPRVSLSDGRLDGLALEPWWTSQQLAGDWRCGLSPVAARELNLRLLAAAATFHAGTGGAGACAGGLSLPVAFDPGCADWLLSALVADLRSTGASEAGVYIELAESQLPRRQPIDAEVLQALRASGAKLVVDRFGSASAPLVQLRHIDPERIKIDRRLVATMITDSDAAAITRSLVALAHTLGMAIVADGIDAYDQCQFLKWEGCEFGQGSYFDSD